MRGAGQGRWDVSEVLAYGGGMQTVAMSILVVKGLLPRPDHIICADTGREADSTWRYLETFAQPLLQSAGLRVEVAPHSLAKVDLYGHNGDLLLPAYTATGKLRTFCSDEWKASVCERYLRSIGVTSATSWIGYTLDERRRVKGYGRSPWFRRYPLIEMNLTRSDCERIVLDAGLPIPEKSACFMCPHRTNAEWRAIRDGEPQQWAEAIAIDEEIRLADQRGGVWLHQSRLPLGQADLDATDRREPDRQCGFGMCWL